MARTCAVSNLVAASCSPRGVKDLDTCGIQQDECVYNRISVGILDVTGLLSVEKFLHRPWLQLTLELGTT